ncbi:hypothetical protein GCM10010266_40220 [Streptomyces griseomycini]|nr:hypothetical protein GCM10010266_40220 [Streptomyces griseomycini]
MRPVRFDAAALGPQAGRGPSTGRFRSAEHGARPAAAWAREWPGLRLEAVGRGSVDADPRSSTRPASAKSWAKSRHGYSDRRPVSFERARTPVAGGAVESAVALVDACGVNESGAFMLRRLQELDPAVRADVLRVLDRVVRGLPAHWRRRKGVPQLMVFLDGPENVRMERTTFRELSEHGYLDEFSRWAAGVPAAKAKEHGCAALVYGDRVHARIFQVGPFGSAWHLPDVRVDVCTAHRDLRLCQTFSLDFEVEGRFFPRLVFKEWVHDAIARARQD